ncbi:DUF309 domain-containing protein [Minwuia thermotolerans]|uniref:DUF309 domain-containing protein n=1 Tax=Minwuia thermotolerans TaxID=2056226 RepID=A0A2M9G556_9PROT|nr:DUF309 domain-containing protein [Minwuia thermotolerans]PJK30859.1 DUF309 domain-containing protein [Minwuia thermotolerans]
MSRPPDSEPPLPPYAYVPGRHPHPGDGHVAGLDGRPAAAVRTHAADLFDRGYYWEAHEAWEGLWRGLKRDSPAERLYRGLIALAAAGVKAREGSAAGCGHHAGRARDLFRALAAGHAAVEHASPERLAAFAEAIAADPPERPAAPGAPPEVVFPAALPRG